MKYILALSVLFLSGCALSSADLIRADYVPERGGVISESWNSWFSSKERADKRADAKMTEYCSPGKYQVQGEAMTSYASSVDRWGGIHYDSNPLVRFVCVQPQPQKQSCWQECANMMTGGQLKAGETPESCIQKLCYPAEKSSMFNYRAPIDIHYPHSPTYLHVRMTA